jgi:hypothetical protein
MNEFLVIPRRLAIALMHAAQNAGERGISGLVFGGPQPQQFVPCADDDGARKVRIAANPGAVPWALFRFRHAEKAPAAADFESGTFICHPEMLLLNASLETKGVLQLHAWRLREGAVVEQDMQIAD